MLNEAKEAISNIDKAQLKIIKSYIQPPEQVMVTLCACCLLFGFDESWENGKRYLLNDMKFLQKYIHFKCLNKEW